ncbi:hypothetical protein [Amycolatopsis anabasis]|uniref:hypothetical protein n=1 Tax=Amycolatopsis anabasis TaxID=1840409 RepID=UPI00131C794B|nr:hypothetical protein [Amycolatopsis anabasis]
MKPGVAEASLSTQLDELPQQELSLGTDIDAAHRVLLDPCCPPAEKKAELLRWIERCQPCLFGRLAAKGTAAAGRGEGGGSAKGLTLDIAWLDESDLARGADHVRSTIQRERRVWKDRAEQGLTSAFLIVFNSPRLARARPSTRLIGVCRRLAELYLIEFGRIEPDVVYLEALPLRAANGELRLFKSSVQLFYPGAHLMRNHDRRIPGGLVFSMNAPGHYARSLVSRGLVPNFDQAVKFVSRNALRTIGNGGIGHPHKLGSSWHHAQPGGTRPEPPHCPPTAAARAATPERFSATYQIDVLIQADVLTDPEPRLDRHRREDVWPSLHLEYIRAQPVPPQDPDYGWFDGMPVDDCAKHFNPWVPVKAVNHPDFNY